MKAMSAFIFVHNFFLLLCMWKASKSPLPPLPPPHHLPNPPKLRPQHLLSDYHFPAFHNFITVRLNFRREKIYIFKQSVTSVFNSHKTQSTLHKNGEDRSSKMSPLFQSFNSPPIISPVCSQMNILYCGGWGGVRNFGFYSSFYLWIINRETRFPFFFYFDKCTPIYVLTRNVDSLSHWCQMSCRPNEHSLFEHY